MGDSDESGVEFEVLSSGVRVLWDRSDPEGTAVVFEPGGSGLEKLSE